MNKVFGVMLFLWVAGWTIAAFRTAAKSATITGPCRCRTEFRTGIRVTR